MGHRKWIRRKVGEKQWQYDFQGGRCHYCSKMMIMENGWKKNPVTGRKEMKSKYATWDHVVPVSKGGSDLLNNRVLACVKCNQDKGSSLVWRSKN
jgi:5-methylcytosine-specific restriction endonuclease McrA